MAKAKPHAPDDKVALYEKLVATNPKVERRGAANPYTSHKGRMFSMLGKGGVMILRLPDGEREAFLKKHKAKLAVQYGATMPEFVEVPEALLANTSELKRYFDLSYAWLDSLNAKPTTKPKKKAATQVVTKKKAR
jgi:TfoX/Sxy family transcriptional regulator of competence genes